MRPLKKSLPSTTATTQRKLLILSALKSSRLYGNLIARHQIRGMAAFSSASFERQFEADGLVAFQAIFRGRVVGMHLWMVDGQVATSHLAAFSDEGYEHMCAYALYWEAIKHFTGQVAWLNLGAGAGVEPESTDGLTRFKQGWSTGTRTAWLCSSILQPDKYARLCAENGTRESSYFPAYRIGEFSGSSTSLQQRALRSLRAQADEGKS